MDNVGFYYGNGTNWIPVKPITAISFNTDIEYLDAGDTYQIEVTITPSNASDKELIWTSSDTSIATVSDTGLVTKVADGQATITARTIDGTNLSATCTVDTFIHITSFELEESSTSIYETYTKQLTPVIIPVNATNKNIEWISSDNTVATVSDTGLVTALVPGNCIITATTEDGGLTATCNITVNADELDNYYELDYIESSGAQYINTGYIPLAHDKFVVECNITAETGAAFRSLFGTRLSNYQSNCYTFFTRFGSNNVPNYARTGNEATGSNFIYGSKITLTTEDDTATWTDGTNTYSVTTTGTINDSVNPLFIFGNNTSGTSGGSQIDCYVYAKIHSFKVYRSNNLIHNYIPVMSKDRTRIGLFDDVDKKLYTSATSTPFTAGTIKPIAVNVEDITELEYIESTGTQYINTLIMPTENLQYELIISDVSGADDTIFIGSTVWAVNKVILSSNGNGFAWWRHLVNSDALRFGIGELSNKNTISVYRNKIIYNGTEVYSDETSYTITDADNIKLFGIDNTSSFNNSFKLHDFSIIDKSVGTVLIDLIPAKYNNYIGLYDKIDHKLYISQTMNSFIAGPEKE